MTSERTSLMDSARAVWPGAASIDVVHGGTPAEGTQDYVVLPSLRSPRWLVPADAPRAAAALESNAGPAWRKAGARMLMGAHRSGLTRRLPTARVRVDVSGHESLVTRLSDLFHEQVTVALRLGSWTHARSIVVRVFAPSGETRAFVKVGVDAGGRAAVRAEAEGLLRVAKLGLTEVVHPEVLDHGPWQGVEVLVMTPLVRRASGGRRDTMPLHAMRHLARAGTPHREALTHSGWYVDVRDRLSQVDDPGLRDRLGAALDRVAEAGADEPFELGAWHGDWTPWNMVRDRERVLLWDWEHFAEDVPVGFDHVHYLAQLLRVTAGTGPDAERTWRQHATELLGTVLGIDERQQELLLVAYLAEVNLRFVLDRQATAEAGRLRKGWGMDLLDREASRL